MPAAIEYPPTPISPPNYASLSGLAFAPPISTSPPPMMKKASGQPQPAYQVQTPPRSDLERMDSTNSMSPSSAAIASGGKTSMVIERLTMDLEKLRREYRAEKAAKEEAQLELQANRARIAKLQEENSHLAAQCAANDSALARKERRLDEMRARLEQADNRTKAAEQQAHLMSQELDETVSRTQQEVSSARNQAKYHEGAYTTLKQEYATINGRIALLKKEFASYQKQMDRRSQEHRVQLTQLEVVIEQERQQQENSDRRVMEMERLLKSYQKTEIGVLQLEKQMQDVVTEMRWCMRLHQAREKESG